MRMSFTNCTDAANHGRVNIPKTDPSYAAKLDRDHDGFGCDKNQSDYVPPKTFKAGTVAKQDVNTLPVTGPGTTYGSLAMLLVVAGVVLYKFGLRKAITFRS